MAILLQKSQKIYRAYVHLLLVSMHLLLIEQVIIGKK